MRAAFSFCSINWLLHINPIRENTARVREYIYVYTYLKSIEKGCSIMERALSKLDKPEPLRWIIASKIFVHVFFRQLMVLGEDVD